MPGGERCAHGTRGKTASRIRAGWCQQLSAYAPDPIAGPPRALAAVPASAVASGGLPFSDVAVCVAAQRIGDPWTRTSREAWPDWRAC